MRAAACIAAALIALSGCSRCGRTTPGKEPSREPPPVEPLPAPALSFDGEASDLLVGMIGEPGQEDPVTVHVLRVTDRGVDVGQALAVPRRGSELPAAAVQGKYLYLARGTGVERREPFTANPVLSVNLGQAPASLLGLAPGCLVGLEGKVEFVDFSSGAGVQQTVFESEEIVKPVDFLVPLGTSAFAAVDDVVTPKYAFVFDLVPGKVAEHRFTAKMPSGPNERYLAVAVHGDELVITASYAVMRGSGNRIYRWSLDKRELAGLPRTELQPRMAGDQDERVKLLVGDKMTYWRGLGMIGDHAFIGAGARGVMHMDVPATEIVLFDAGGYVLDLVVAGSRILVLTSELVEKKGEVALGQRHIVELAWDESEKKLVENARHVLTVPIDWLMI
ncbi:MAG: hypothetical protein JRG91_01870 [Deltaproteobacteria bacterium]|nr:hypothetical protein [Deltaproteobacteria bacterium]